MTRLHQADGVPPAGHTRVHTMPFGPRPRDTPPGDGYCFRLWAPGQQQVIVRLYPARGGERRFPCTETGGWHRCEVAEARPGDRYAFMLDGGLTVPDPASRFNPDGVHEPSQLIDPTAFLWDDDWRGRPWPEAVIYELHVGTFTPEGTYAAAEGRLGRLAALGITAIELMPLAECAGNRSWGYDGVLPFTPTARYGTPAALKHFVQATHRHGLMVLLDVVYDHFGADGNYLRAYAPQFFTDAHPTPWGQAIAYDGAAAPVVRAFIIHNALYWLQEFSFDGLRLDAVNAMFDASHPHILEELAHRVRALRGNRPTHLLLGNAGNQASLLGPPATPGRYDARWNDDFHHAAHALLTGKHEGERADLAGQPVRLLARSLVDGFARQGQPAPHDEPSAGLPPTAFVNFLQNHDQLGERLITLTDPKPLRALVALQLLAPSPPLLFMGEEAGATTPFLYFADCSGVLGDAVGEARRREFAAVENPDDPAIPDPCAESTFLASKLDWAARQRPRARGWLAFYRTLLKARHRVVIPRLPGLVAVREGPVFAGERAFKLRWQAADGSMLVLAANLADGPAPPLPTVAAAPFAAVGDAANPDSFGPWAVRAWLLPPATGEDG